MKVKTLLPILSVIVVLGMSAAAQKPVVKPDKENVVASRLEGTWIPEKTLTKRLLGSQRTDPEGPMGQITFKVDPAVAGKVPEKYGEFLAERQIYLAGDMTSRGKAHPFLLIVNKGNPHIVYFREREGDPMGDAESFNVMLAPASRKENDLLFIGGDFNNQPFRAYERARKDASSAGTEGLEKADTEKEAMQTPLDEMEQARKIAELRKEADEQVANVPAERRQSRRH